MTQLRVVADESKRDEGQAEPGVLDPEAEGLARSSSTDRADDGGGRPVSCMPYIADEDGQQRAAGRSGLRGRAPRRRTSTTARSRSTAARTRSSATSSPRRSWGCGCWGTEAGDDGDRMDFDLRDEQRLLKDSVDRLIADRYEFRAAQEIRARPRRLRARAVGAVRRARPARPAVRRRRRAASAAAPVETDDRDGGVRARAGARAVSRDRHARRRPAASRRQRRRSRRR